MTYLVTGATGFIGRRLVDVLLSRGHTVNYLARKRSSSLDSRAAYFCWTGKTEPPLECMGRLDGVIHLAGEPVAQRWTNDVKDRIYRSRVEGTRLLVSAIGKLKHKPAVLVSASAVGYYGDRGGQVLTEEAGPGTGFLAELCVDWEREAQRARELGLRVVPLRISVVLGNGGGALEKMLNVFRMGLGGRLGSGKQWMAWIHIHDLLRMTTFALDESNVDGPLNASSPSPVTNAQFTNELAKSLHRPALITVPRFALRLAMGEIANYLVESARAIPQRAQQKGFQFEYGSIRAALMNIVAARGRALNYVLP